MHWKTYKCRGSCYWLPCPRTSNLVGITPRRTHDLRGILLDFFKHQATHVNRNKTPSPPSRALVQARMPILCKFLFFTHFTKCAANTPNKLYECVYIIIIKICITTVFIASGVNIAKNVRTTGDESN